MEEKQIFGFLTVIERGERRGRGGRDWICQCVCGSIKSYRNESIVRTDRKTQSCGCRGKGYGDVVSVDSFNNTRNHALNGKKPKEFTVTYKYLCDLFRKQNGLCSLSGELLHFNKKGRTASLDRIDNKIGYTDTNVQWVHADVNMMKFTLKQERFIELCYLVSIFDNKFPKYEENQGNLHALFKGYKSIPSSIFCSIRQHSLRNNLEVNIDLKYLQEILEKQGGICSLSGVKLSPFPVNKSNMSVDRIDSNLGYVKGNIQLIQKDLNKMKRSYPQDVFIHWCRKITNYQISLKNINLENLQKELEKKSGEILCDTCGTAKNDDPDDVIIHHLINNKNKCINLKICSTCFTNRILPFIQNMSHHQLEYIDANT